MRKTENIGARRLHTVLEKLLEGVSAFSSPHGEVIIDAAYVNERLQEVAEQERFGTLYFVMTMGWRSPLYNRPVNYCVSCVRKRGYDVLSSSWV